jgi:hypothetical protein
MSGDFPGAIVDFHSGFKGNLIDAVGAIRLLKQFSETVRPGKPKGQVTTLQILMEFVNNGIGLKDPSTSAWASMFAKSVLNESTKVSSVGFPSSFIHSVKAHNKASSNEGVLYSLGYVPKGISVTKLREVLLTPTREEEKKGKKELSFVSINEKSERKTDFREYRAAVCGSLPYIPLPSAETKKEMTVAPMAVKSRKSLLFWQEHKEIVDACNLAYATLKASSKKGSKATPANYTVARNKLINLTANVPFQTAAGQRFDRYTEIPQNLREFLEKYYHRKITGGKRSSDDMEVDASSDVPALSSEKMNAPSAKLAEGTGFLPKREKQVKKRKVKST